MQTFWKKARNSFPVLVDNACSNAPTVSPNPFLIHGIVPFELLSSFYLQISSSLHPYTTISLPPHALLEVCRYAVHLYCARQAPFQSLHLGLCCQATLVPTQLRRKCGWKAILPGHQAPHLGLWINIHSHKLLCSSARRHDRDLEWSSCAPALRCPSYIPPIRKWRGGEKKYLLLDVILISTTWKKAGVPSWIQQYVATKLCDCSMPGPQLPLAVAQRAHT